MINIYPSALFLMSFEILALQNGNSNNFTPLMSSHE